ncbi:hypothetical protein VE03_02013 [Pseudogymnoascus sp. 23342-1-I1]|nr:hypothetical protein VE03_02013 [Pseudogymnoascus sp. 23342-1-I1]
MADAPPSAQPPSKNALKKAAKEAEKAKKKAGQAQQHQEELQLRQKQDLADVGEWEDKLCVFRGALENARVQSTKLAFLAMSQGLHSIQLVVAEDGENVSRQMVKFAGDIPSESLCVVHGLVKRTTEKIKSATIQDYEISVQKIFVVSKAHTPLPLQPADSERALPSEETDKEDITSPLASLNTRLNNRVLDLRAKINHSIFILKDGVDSLFQEFLRGRGFSIWRRLSMTMRRGLGERYKRETELIGKVYAAQPFKLPENVPRLRFEEGIAILREAGEEIGDYDDLTTPQEKKLGKLVLEKYGSDFYTLNQFPQALRPFYTMPSSPTAADNPYSNSFDMFMRGQEICSGAQRVHTYELLVERIRALGMDPQQDGLRDYVDGFRYGCAPHGGGGFGLERIVAFYLGLPNIRLASLFPRDPTRVLP